MTEENKPIKIQMKIKGGLNSVIPAGKMEVLTIEITNGFAAYHFLDCKITKLFSEGQKKDGVESIYNERLKKTICKYPNMNKEEIAKHISNRLKILGG